MEISSVVDSSLSIADKGVTTVQQEVENATKARDDGGAQDLVIANQETGVAPAANQGSQGSLTQVSESERLESLPEKQDRMEEIVQVLREAGHTTGSILDIYA